MLTQEPEQYIRKRFNKKEAIVMPRWKLKDCPRCSGDIFMDIDENGWLGHCLQCGYMGKGPSIAPEVAAPETVVALNAEIGRELARPLHLVKK